MTDAFDDLLEVVKSTMDEPKETAEHRVAMAVREAYLATAEIYKLCLDPETATLLAKEEGDLWSIHGRVKSVLDEIRADHA